MRLYIAYIYELGQHAKRANAQIVTFGFCRHAKPKQKTKRA
jgi:hypothetical protein